MAKLTSTTPDTYKSLVSGTFGATGQSGSFVSDANNNLGTFNVAVWGTFSGSVTLERSFDGGTTWITCGKDSSGTAATYTAPASLTVSEPEQNVLYRLNCTAYVSGTINYRISK